MGNNTQEKQDLISEILKKPESYDLKQMAKDEQWPLTQGDIGFIERVLSLSEVDPEITKRVLAMRLKIMNAIKLTQNEVSELIESLQCKSFPESLNISGYRFGELNLSNAVINGNYDSSHIEVGDDCDESRLIVKGNSSEQDKTIKGNNNEINKTIKGNNNEINKTIKGNNCEIDKTIKGNSDERYKTIKGKNNEQDKTIGSKRIR